MHCKQLVPTACMAHLGVDLHGQEEPEVGMWSDRMELLLQTDQPLRSKMDILEQHPPDEEREGEGENE